MNSPKFVKISDLENSIETQLLESILNERNIPHNIRSFYDTAYDGLFQFQKGWGEILAPLDYKKEVMEILSSIRSSPEDDQGFDGEKINGK
jgi:hypothetical protein